MDLLSIDVTKIPKCKIGDWCIFWDKHNTIKNLAVQNNLISYELMTRIASRVKVIFKNQ
jgi:alanine racemase